MKWGKWVPKVISEGAQKSAQKMTPLKIRICPFLRGFECSPKITRFFGPFFRQKTPSSKIASLKGVSPGNGAILPSTWKVVQKRGPKNGQNPIFGFFQVLQKWPIFGPPFFRGVQNTICKWGSSAKNREKRVKKGPFSGFGPLFWHPLIGAPKMEKSKGESPGNGDFAQNHRAEKSQKGAQKRPKIDFLAFFSTFSRVPNLPPLRRLWHRRSEIGASKKCHFFSPPYIKKFAFLDPFFSTSRTDPSELKCQKANHPEIAFSARITGLKKVKKGSKKVKNRDFGHFLAFFHFFAFFEKWPFCPL